jgi:hypothetical protein
MFIAQGIAVAVLTDVPNKSFLIDVTVADRKL